MMTAITVLVLVTGALVGGFISGLAGFGLALIALGVWLYVLSPTVAATVVIICSVASQTSTMPAIWPSIDLRLVWPFLVGALLGVPLGAWLIPHVDANAFKTGVGLLLIVFPTVRFLDRRPHAMAAGGQVADGLVGFAGGIMGGLSGLSGPLPTLWASVRGWGKDQRRSLFQTFNWTALVLALIGHLVEGLVTRQVVILTLMALPATLIGSWLGARAYRRLSDLHFDRVVLFLLLASGVSLLASQLAPHLGR